MNYTFKHFWVNSLIDFSNASNENHLILSLGWEDCKSHTKLVVGD